MKHGNFFYKCTVSTEKSPIAFFCSFFKKKCITNAINDFIDHLLDLNDPENTLGYSVSYISPDKLTYHIEHSFLNYDPETFEGSYEYVTQIVTLKDTLQEKFREQFYESKRLLKQRLENASQTSTIKENRRIASNILMNLTLLYDSILKDEIYKGHEEVCIRPIEAFVKLLYRDFRDFTPAQSSDSRIIEILKKSNSGENLYEEYKLKPDVIPQLFERISNNLIPFSSHNKQRDINSLIAFLIDGVEIDEKIKLYGQVGMINYTIALLLKYSQKSRRYLEKLKILYINDQPFFASSCDTDYYRYPLSNSREANTIYFVLKKALE